MDASEPREEGHRCGGEGAGSTYRVSSTDSSKERVSVSRMVELCHELRRRWVSRGIAVNDVASDEMIVRLEARLGVLLPEALKLYLRIANGMTDAGWDGNMIHFWGDQQIFDDGVSRSSREPCAFVPIADYSIDAWAWVMPVNGGVVSDVVHTFGPPMVSCRPSLGEFIESYLVGENLEPAMLEVGVLSWRSRVE